MGARRTGRAILSVAREEKCPGEIKAIIASPAPPGSNVEKHGQLTTHRILEDTGALRHPGEWVAAEVEVLSYEHPQLDPCDKDAQTLLALGTPLQLGSGHIALQAESQPVWFRHSELMGLEDERGAEQRTENGRVPEADSKKGRLPLDGPSVLAHDRVWPRSVAKYMGCVPYIVTLCDGVKIPWPAIPALSQRPRDAQSRVHEAHFPFNPYHPGPRGLLIRGLRQAVRPNEPVGAKRSGDQVGAGDCRHRITGPESELRHWLQYGHPTGPR